MSKFNSYIFLSITATTTNEEQQTISGNLKTATTAPPPQKKKKKDFFKTLFDPVDADVNNEVDLYLSDTSQKLSSLRKHPKQLFVKYNAALLSSASVERLFSLAGRIFVPLSNSNTKDCLI
jgi:hypothetical protein